MTDLPSPDLRHQRIDYTGDLLPDRLDDWQPLDLFRDWMTAALAEQHAGRLDEASAVALSTASESDGQLRVSSRMVLLKGFDESGFSFFSHYDSAKGQALAAQPQAALLFWWPSLNRQVRIEGAVHRLERAESEDYFAVRPRGSQLGAWASHQSRPRAERQSLIDEVAVVTQRFGDGPIPCPPGWGGFCVVPGRFEFWQGQPSRLHDRAEFLRVGNGWQARRLDP